MCGEGRRDGSEQGEHCGGAQGEDQEHHSVSGCHAHPPSGDSCHQGTAEVEVVLPGVDAIAGGHDHVVTGAERALGPQIESLSHLVDGLLHGEYLCESP